MNKTAGPATNSMALAAICMEKQNATLSGTKQILMRVTSMYSVSLATALSKITNKIVI